MAGSFIFELGFFDWYGWFEPASDSWFGNCSVPTAAEAESHQNCPRISCLWAARSSVRACRAPPARFG